MKKLLCIALGLFITFSLSAQSADEIINTYFENTGGYDNWGNLKGIKISAKVNQGGMEIPLQIVQLADGRQFTQFEVQGQTFKQQVFDGETVWNINFQSLKAEESDAETIANVKLDANDFPDSFYDYKKKGYTVELVGEETVDGAETYKIKLQRENRIVDGAEIEDVSYYFFDKEFMVPIAVESEIKQGPQKGAISEIKMSDYQEVDGYYFPFSMVQGIKGAGSQPLIIESIEVNPTVDDSEFTMPEE